MQANSEKEMDYRPPRLTASAAYSCEVFSTPEPSYEGFWRPVDLHCPLSTNSYAQLDLTVQVLRDHQPLRQILHLQIAFLTSLSFVVNPVGFLLQ
jgi:hypothetical protein